MFIPTIGPHRPLLLLLDTHSSHNNLGIIEVAKKEDIVTNYQNQKELIVKEPTYKVMELVINAKCLIEVKETHFCTVYPQLHERNMWLLSMRKHIFFVL